MVHHIALRCVIRVLNTGSYVVSSVFICTICGLQSFCRLYSNYIDVFVFSLLVGGTEQARKLHKYISVAKYTIVCRYLMYVHMYVCKFVP